MEFNDQPDRAAAWVDGEQVYETAFAFKDRGGSNLVGGFFEIAFGFRLWGEGPQAFDIYYDIALDIIPIRPGEST